MVPHCEDEEHRGGLVLVLDREGGRCTVQPEGAIRQRPPLYKAALWRGTGDLCRLRQRPPRHNRNDMFRQCSSTCSA